MKREVRHSDSLFTAIAKGSRLFLTAELDLDSAVPAFLRILGQASGVSRCYIFCNSSTITGTKLTSLLYEWSENDLSRLGNPEYQDIPWIESGMGRWLERLSQGLPVHGTIGELPEQERTLLSSQDVSSVAAFPIFLHGNWWGFLGFNDCSSSRIWKQDELEALSIGSTIIETALERRDTESILIRSKGRYDSLLSALPSMIMTIDSSMKIIECSDQAREILDILPSELIGRNLEDVCCQSDGNLLAEQIERVFSLNVPIRLETVLSRSDNIPRDVRVSLTPVPGYRDSDPLVVLSVEDITTFRKMELEKNALEEQVNRRSRIESMAILAGGIAHDFSGIMSVISWNAKLALRDLPRGSSKASMERILSATERAQELAQQMLAYSGKGYFNPISVSISKMISEICSLIRPSLPQEVSMNCILPEGLPRIEADPTQIDQLILNLVKNALEALEQGKGSIIIEADSRLCEKECFEHSYYGREPEAGEYLLIRVSDDGCGMTRNTQNKLFDPFFTTKSRGRGLGLSVVLGIVRAHSGAVQVQSRKGEGTTFQVFLPVFEEYSTDC